MHTSTAVEASPVKPRRWYHQLYFWVLGAIILGILLGWLAPSVGTAVEPIGTTFVSAMRMLIGPIVFLTIVAGIASVADLKKVGLTALKALAYFQVGTTVALVMGLVAINIFRLATALTRRFHAGSVCGGVGTLKSAPDLRGCGLSRTTIRMFKEHLPGEQHYRFLSASSCRHHQFRGGGSSRWGAVDGDDRRVRAGRGALVGVGAVA